MKQGFNKTAAELAVAEYVQPAIAQNPDNFLDTSMAVAFFREGCKTKFCIPCRTDTEATALTQEFRDLFVELINRYEDLKLWARGEVEIGE